MGIVGYVHSGGGVYIKSTASIQAIISVVVSGEFGTFNCDVASGQAVSSIVLVGDGGAFCSSELTTVRCVSSTILNSESRIFYINRRTVYIAAIGAVNQEGALH